MFYLHFKYELRKFQVCIADIIKINLILTCFLHNKSIMQKMIKESQIESYSLLCKWENRYLKIVLYLLDCPLLCSES